MSRNKDAQTIAASTGIGEDTVYGAGPWRLYLSSRFTFKGFERPRPVRLYAIRQPIA